MPDPRVLGQDPMPEPRRRLKGGVFEGFLPAGVGTALQEASYFPVFPGAPPAMNLRMFRLDIWIDQTFWNSG
jgi:hypothetical protein